MTSFGHFPYSVIARMHKVYSNIVTSQNLEVELQTFYWELSIHTAYSLPVLIKIFSYRKFPTSNRNNKQVTPSTITTFRNITR
jgi:hypothetical protein